jgi:alpha-glucosidase
VLVAPVLEEGARERSVYLPQHEGGWYDWHDGRHYPGGATATVAAPLGRLPLFLRAGALIPLGNGERIGDEREVLACGLVEGATGELYEDDGETADWRGDGSALIRFEVRGGELAIQQVQGRAAGLTRIEIRSIAAGDYR